MEVFYAIFVFTCLKCALNLHFAQKLLRKWKFHEVARTTWSCCKRQTLSSTNRVSLIATRNVDRSAGLKLRRYARELLTDLEMNLPFWFFRKEKLDASYSLGSENVKQEGIVVIWISTIGRSIQERVIFLITSDS